MSVGKRVTIKILNIKGYITSIQGDMIQVMYKVPKLDKYTYEYFGREELQ